MCFRESNYVAIKRKTEHELHRVYNDSDAKQITLQNFYKNSIQVLFIAINSVHL